MRWPVLTLAAVLLVAASAHAAEASDADALSLADQAPVAPQRAQDWRLFAEVARVHNVLRDARGGSRKRSDRDVAPRNER